MLRNGRWEISLGNLHTKHDTVEIHFPDYLLKFPKHDTIIINLFLFFCIRYRSQAKGGDSKPGQAPKRSGRTLWSDAASHDGNPLRDSFVASAITRRTVTDIRPSTAQQEALGAVQHGLTGFTALAIDGELVVLAANVRSYEQRRRLSEPRYAPHLYQGRALEAAAAAAGPDTDGIHNPYAYMYGPLWAKPEYEHALEGEDDDDDWSGPRSLLRQLATTPSSSSGSSGGSDSCSGGGATPSKGAKSSSKVTSSTTASCGAFNADRIDVGLGELSPLDKR